MSPVAAELARVTGLPLEAYRPDHVAARIGRALEREGVASVDDLVRRLAADRDARARFRRSVALSHSGLFRDRAQFDVLEREVLPELVADGRRISVWSAGCSDGSELYSVALLLERLNAVDRSFLLGSDLLEENLALAARGLYGDVEISERLRARVRWERRDLPAEGAPAGRWRLVFCRNLAIYLNAEAKLALHRTLASSLAVGGFLLLGRSERLAEPAGLGLVRVAPHLYRRAS